MIRDEGERCKRLARLFAQIASSLVPAGLAGDLVAEMLLVEQLFPAPAGCSSVGRAPPLPVEFLTITDDDLKC